MNREEAIKFFELQTQDEQALIDGINLNPDDFVFGAEGPEQYINDCQNNIDAYETSISALRGPQPDPITGLVPCGCGGEVYPHYQLGWCHESGVQAFEVSTGCDGCGTCTKPRRGHYANGIDKDDTELASKRDWNTSHGYTAPPLPEVKG